MIIGRYREVQPGTRVVLASGRTVHVIATVPLGTSLLVRLRNDTGTTRDVTVNPDDFVLYATPDVEDTIVDSLRERFPDIEFLRRI